MSKNAYEVAPPRQWVLNYSIRDFIYEYIDPTHRCFVAFWVLFYENRMKNDKVAMYLVDKPYFRQETDLIFLLQDPCSDSFPSPRTSYSNFFCITSNLVKSD